MKPATKTGAAAAPPQFVRRIVCDDRERRSGVPAALAQHPDVELTIRRLTLGDYLIEKTLVVERKTLADFARSVKDGRLFPQINRLVASRNERPCLILEGTRRRYRRLAITRTSFLAALSTVIVVFGLPVLRSRYPDETASLILTAVNQLRRSTIRPLRRHNSATTSLARQQRLLLQSIRGVGPRRAENLLATLGTPAGVADAGKEALMTVPGVGDHSSDLIYRVFHSVEKSRM
jgi:ERCC4-type nuclease